MPIPLALATPAALAGLAYLNAKTSFWYDRKLVGNVIVAQISAALRQNKDRLSMFYDLEDHAKGKHKDRTFIIFEGRSWTYEEVYEIALKYGTWFKTVHGIKPKDIVVMDFMNSEKFVFMFFGLWAIGAKPAFINYNLTSKSLAHCIRVSAAKKAFFDPQVQSNVTQEVRDELPDVDFYILTSELETEVLATKGVREPNSARSEDKATNAAALIYTSGTTGLPKPAIVSWQKILVGAIFVPKWLGYAPPDVFYTCMPLYHTSAFLLGLLTTLSTRATIVIGKKFSTKTFWKDVRKHNVTVIQYVGETCRYLLSAPPETDPVTGENLDKQNKVWVAFGNGLRPDIWNQFKERFGIEAIAEFYSATESAGGSFNLSRNDFTKGAIGRNGTIASLLMGSSSAIVALDYDTEQPYRNPKTGFCERMPAGQPGELLYELDGKDISKKFQGYFNNTKSTESKILRDVFKKGDAWFRSGDVISTDSENRTYFSDRIGDTFRWKSENISTNEVAEVLGAHSAVQEANVYGIELPNHDGRAGCVALVLNGDGPSSHVLSSLAEHTSSNLPKFAQPLFLRLIKEMQTTGTYKQLKHVLRAEGVDPAKTNSDEVYWLQGKTYVKFNASDWENLKGGKVKL